ncbi:DUF5989 family protein [Thermodesulfobacteriota bacterium]
MDKQNENPETPDQGEPEGDQKDLPLKFENNRELLLFLFLMIRENKKWWLLPLLFVLAILSLFASLTGNTSILPAIYALF